MACERYDFQPPYSLISIPSIPTNPAVYREFVSACYLFSWLVAGSLKDFGPVWYGATPPVLVIFVELQKILWVMGGFKSFHVKPLERWSNLTVFCYFRMGWFYFVVLKDPSDAQIESLNYDCRFLKCHSRYWWARYSPKIPWDDAYLHIWMFPKIVVPPNHPFW